jgi:hypothetical protein
VLPDILAMQVDGSVGPEAAVSSLEIFARISFSLPETTPRPREPSLQEALSVGHGPFAQRGLSHMIKDLPSALRVGAWDKTAGAGPIRHRTYAQGR